LKKIVHFIPTRNLLTQTPDQPGMAWNEIHAGQLEMGPETHKLRLLPTFLFEGATWMR
jgi:hypothetical protein